MKNLNTAKQKEQIKVL